MMDKKIAARTLQRLVSELRQTFEDRLQSVLVYGSFQTRSRLRDIDLVIVFRERTRNDALLLRRCFRKVRLANLQFQTYSKLDLFSSAEFFSIHTSGCLFWYVLQNATVLLGDNPFRAMKPPSYSALAASVLQKTQQYRAEVYCDFVSMTGRNSTRLRNQLDKHWKRTLMLLVDWWLVKMGILIKPRQALLHAAHHRLLDDKTLQLLRSFERNHCIPGLTARTSARMAAIRLRDALWWIECLTDRITLEIRQRE